MWDSISDQVQTWSVSLQHNISESVTRLTLQDFLRLVIIVGGYAMLRPYLIKLGGRFQAKDHEREFDETEASSIAAVSPHSLRGQVTVPDDTDDEDSDGRDHSRHSKTAEWGRQARHRQRHMIRRLLEAEERARQDEAASDSDRDIEEFLIKDP